MSRTTNVRDSSRNSIHLECDSEPSQDFDATDEHLREIMIDEAGCPGTSPDHFYRGANFFRTEFFRTRFFSTPVLFLVLIFCVLTSPSPSQPVAPARGYGVAVGNPCGSADHNFSSELGLYYYYYLLDIKEISVRREGGGCYDSCAPSSPIVDRHVSGIFIER